MTTEPSTGVSGGASAAPETVSPGRPPLGRRLGHGLDPRMVAMLLVLIAIWIVLDLTTDGLFLTPRNLYNLSIQTCVIAWRPPDGRVPSLSQTDPRACNLRRYRNSLAIGQPNTTGA